MGKLNSGVTRESVGTPFPLRPHSLSSSPPFSRPFLRSFRLGCCLLLFTFSCSCYPRSLGTLLHLFLHPRATHSIAPPLPSVFIPPPFYDCPYPGITPVAVRLNLSGDQCRGRANRDVHHGCQPPSDILWAFGESFESPIAISRGSSITPWTPVE